MQFSSSSSPHSLILVLKTQTPNPLSFSAYLTIKHLMKNHHYSHAQTCLQTFRSLPTIPMNINFNHQQILNYSYNFYMYPYTTQSQFSTFSLKIVLWVEEKEPFFPLFFKVNMQQGGGSVRYMVARV